MDVGWILYSADQSSSAQFEQLEEAKTGTFEDQSPQPDNLLVHFHD